MKGNSTPRCGGPSRNFGGWYDGFSPLDGRGRYLLLKPMEKLTDPICFLRHDRKDSRKFRLPEASPYHRILWTLRAIILKLSREEMSFNKCYVVITLNIENRFSSATHPKAGVPNYLTKLLESYLSKRP